MGGDSAKVWDVLVSDKISDVLDSELNYGRFLILLKYGMFWILS